MGSGERVAGSGNRSRGRDASIEARDRGEGAGRRARLVRVSATSVMCQRDVARMRERHGEWDGRDASGKEAAKARGATNGGREGRDCWRKSDIASHSEISATRGRRASLDKVEGGDGEDATKTNDGVTQEEGRDVARHIARRRNTQEEERYATKDTANQKREQQTRDGRTAKRHS